MNKKMIDKIIKASGISEGEIVLLHYWGEREEEEVLDDFMEAVVAVGASPIELRESKIRNQRTFACATKTCFSEKYFTFLSQIDTVIDLFTYQPRIHLDNVDEEHKKFVREYMSHLFQALAKAKRFLQIRIPTKENALESGLDPEVFIERMNQAYDIDYDRLKEDCEMMKRKFEQAEGVNLHTGDGHCLSLTYQGREWLVDAGDGDLPCGEIYIAPIEDKTNGEFYFKKLYIEDVGVYEDVVLYADQGVIKRSNHPKVNDFLKTLSKAERTICELGFGMNEHVPDLCGYTVLDEKMKDTFHIAIGANVMFGGTNQANIHIDFVGTATKVEFVQ